MSSTRVVYATSASAPAHPAGPLISKERARSLGKSLLQAYVRQLAAHPLRTKCITSGIFNFIQDILGNHLAGVPPKRVSKDAPFYEKLAARLKLDSRALKMFVYGFFVSAPLSHFTTGVLQRVFAGRTNTFAGKLLQVLASLVFQAPLTVISYLSCTAVINGMRSTDEIVHFVKSRFLTLMKVSLFTTPFGMFVAQYCLPPELWVPWFNGVTFAIGTTLSVMIKKGSVKQHKDKLKETKKE